MEPFQTPVPKRSDHGEAYRHAVHGGKHGFKGVLWVTVGSRCVEIEPLGNDGIPRYARDAALSPAADGSRPIPSHRAPAYWPEPATCRILGGSTVRHQGFGGPQS